MQENGTSILQTDKATIRFGGLVAVNELTMNVGKGEIYGLIGPNGAGKTTIFNLLTGVYEPTSGDIRINGTRVNGLKPYQISRLGVSRTFQNIRLFPSMTVLENVVTACHRHANQNMLDAVFRLPRYFADESEHRKFAMELLEIFDLAKYKDEGGTSLPYGNQRRLEIVRALATRPNLLLLDEPSLGLAPLVVHAIFEAIDEIKGEGTTILLVEQNANAALHHSDRAYVLETGRIFMEGVSKEVAQDPRVKEAYLGE